MTDSEKTRGDAGLADGCQEAFLVLPSLKDNKKPQAEMFADLNSSTLLTNRNSPVTDDAVVVHDIEVDRSHGTPDPQQSQDHEPGQHGVLRASSSSSLHLLSILAL